MSARSRIVARTLRGFTWKRFALLCGIVGLAAIGHAMATYLGRGPARRCGRSAFSTFPSSSSSAPSGSP